MDAVAPVLEVPGTRADARRATATARPAEPKRAPEKRAQEKPAPETADRAEPRVAARVSYDREDSRMVVEILNPRTGDVIKRLPPDLAAAFAEEQTGRPTGVLVNQSA